MRLLIIILLLFSQEAFAQQSTEWLNSLENPSSTSFNELQSKNVLLKYLEHDFSGLLLPKTEILGFIGNNFQRIEVIFTSIDKSESTHNLYYVQGQSTVRQNSCDFEGTITIEQIREFKNMHYGLDSMYKDAGFKSQGILIGRYQFSENPLQKHVGLFEGIMTLWWYVDRNGNIQYDALNTQSDNYKNNQYVGTWSEYGKEAKRTCNWGEFRIPFSGDLDIGAAEFQVNPKYKSEGWEDFKDN